MKTILLKLSGHFFKDDKKQMITHIIEQIILLIQEGYRFGIVMGGGNFFRGAQQAQDFNLRRSTADMVGMLATVMNGLMLCDLLRAHNIDTLLLNTLHIPQITDTLNQQTLDQARAEDKKCIIFAGGTGNPYFSTDTNAIIRALQIDAIEVWKATNIDFIYTDDPAKNKESKPIKKISYEAFVEQKLQVMDVTAITLASQHQLPLRIFNIFNTNALVTVAHNKDFGSIIN